MTRGVMLLCEFNEGKPCGKEATHFYATKNEWGTPSRLSAVCKEHFIAYADSLIDKVRLENL